MVELVQVLNRLAVEFRGKYVGQFRRQGLALLQMRIWSEFFVIVILLLQPIRSKQVNQGQERRSQPQKSRSLGQDIYIGQGHINLYRLRSHKSGSKSVDTASLNAVQCTFWSVKLNSIQAKVQVNDAINLRWGQMWKPIWVKTVNDDRSYRSIQCAAIAY